MKWYFENVALQNELKRDHPAVTEMIESLTAQLKVKEDEIGMQLRDVDYWHKNYLELEAQLTEANHTIERLVSEAANTPELLKELIEEKETISKLVEHGEFLVGQMHDAEGELAEAREEIERLNKKDAIREELWQATLAKLSRYEGGVEVDGIVSFAGADRVIRIREVNDHSDFMYRQKVKVLVMKEEGEWTT